jgi:phenylacetate-CoA ligase
MPLLRYMTDDLAIPKEGACSCGSHFRMVESIQGRRCSYILTPEGYRISAANHIFHGVDNIIEGQFYQEKMTEVLVRVVANERFDENDQAILVKNTLENTSPQMQVLVERVPFIPRGANGKFISIINKLDNN